MSKPKQSRKRKHEPKKPDVDIELSLDEPRAKLPEYDEEAEKEDERLSHILFGDSSAFLNCLETNEKSSSMPCEDSGVGEDDSEQSEDSERRPVWHDEDDDGIDVDHALKAQRRKLPEGGINSRTNKYSDLLKNKFQTIIGTPKWAQIDKQRTEDDSDEELLKTCGFIGKTKDVSLPAGALEFKKVKDLNCETYTEGPQINSIEFHPTSSVALVAGYSGIVSLFSVDGKRNNKLHSVAFERFPILCAKFTQNGNEAIFGSRHKHLFRYDLLAAKPTRFNLPQGMTHLKNFTVSPSSDILAAYGKWGEVHLLTTSSIEKIASLKQDSEVTALEFSPNGKLLFGHSNSGEITVWDVNMRRVKHRFNDEGCLQGSALSISSSNQFIAAGSAQGVVNMYNMDEVLSSNLPKPRRTILNLTTSITDLKFNPTSEILALSSVEIPNSLKLCHVGSGKVFSNFPPFGSKMGNINSINFSPGSGYLAFGNRKSVVALYRLKHYKNY